MVRRRVSERRFDPAGALPAGFTGPGDAPDRRRSHQRRPALVVTSRKLHQANHWYEKRFDSTTTPPAPAPTAQAPPSTCTKNSQEGVVSRAGPSAWTRTKGARNRRRTNCARFSCIT